MSRYRWLFCVLNILSCHAHSNAQYVTERPFDLPANEPYYPVLKGVKMMLMREVPPYPGGMTQYEDKDTSYLAFIDKDGYTQTAYYYDGGARQGKYVIEYRNGKWITFRHFQYRRRTNSDGSDFLDTSKEVSRYIRMYPRKRTIVEREYHWCDSSLPLHQEVRYVYDDRGRVLSKTSKHFMEYCRTVPGAIYDDSTIYRYSAFTILSVKYKQGEEPQERKNQITVNKRGNMLQQNRSVDGKEKDVYKYDMKGRIVEYGRFMNKAYDEEYRRMNGNSLRWLADKILWTYTGEGWPKSITYYEREMPTLKFVYEYIR